MQCSCTIWLCLCISLIQTRAFLSISSRGRNAGSCPTFLLHAITKAHLEHAKLNERDLEDFNGPVTIRFSNNFQRHAVYQDSRLVESFEFFDDAIEAYPSAQFAIMGFQTFDNELPDLGIVAGGGKDEQTLYRQVISGEELRERTQRGYQALLTLSNLVTGSTTVSIVGYLADRVGKFRFLTHTNTTISSNYANLLHLLNQIGFTPAVAKQSVVHNFPQVCLYDPKEVAERLRFLLSPIPPANYLNTSHIDWPLLAAKGFGTGFTKDQVRLIVKGIPHILAMYYEDAAQKPNFLYFHQTLQVPKELCDEVRETLFDYLDGATPSDVSMVAYVKSIGASWSQLNILLQAFPSLVTCDTDPAWVMYHKSATRFVFKEHALHYLRARLQVSTGTVQAMIKTHSSLVSYSVPHNILPTLNAIQKGLGLSSKDTRKIMLRMPSLVGMSIENGLQPRLSFFIDEIGLTREELSKMALKQPSLLHSSIENSLRPKVAFFLDDLSIPRTGLRNMIKITPLLLGLSLEENLRPTAQAFMDYCEMSESQMGFTLIKNPDLLTLSWKRNLLPTLQFLQKRLDLSTCQLRDLMCAAPRIVKFSIKTSLGPKIDMIQDALSPNGDIRQVLLMNPSLLFLTAEALEKRLKLGLLSGIPLENVLIRRQNNTNNKFSRPVIEISLDPNEVPARYSSAKDAATKLDISLQKIYALCRSGKVFNGNTYAYAELALPASSIQVRTTSYTNSIQKRQFRPKQGERNEEPAQSLRNAILNSTYPLEFCYDKDIVPFVVYVAGRPFPADDFEQVRGFRRAGGMCLYFPQVAHGSEALVERLRQATIRSFAQIMPENEGGTCYTQGSILNGYPYLRPSRNRCELYACHDALKVILQLLNQEAEINSNSSLLKAKVDIYTDSDYAWKLLRNHTRILEWSSFVSEEAVNYEGPGQRSWANLDLLYPLSRTYSRLVALTSRGFNASGPTLGIQFRHCTSDGVSDYSSVLAQKALIAANWSYQCASTANAMSKTFT